MSHDYKAESATLTDLIAVAEILVDHRGEDNPITSREIADETGLDSLDSTPCTRGVLRRLECEHDLPIASSNKGYYLIEEHGEARDYLQNLESRKQGIEQRKKAVMSAVERRGTAQSEAMARSWVDELQDQLVESTEDDA